MLARSATPAPAASAARDAGSWVVPCPFDSTKALLPVTCGRLKVPENPQGKLDTSCADTRTLRLVR